MNRQLLIASLASGLLIIGLRPALTAATTTAPTCKVLTSVKTNLTQPPLFIDRKNRKRYIAQIPIPSFVPSSTIAPKEPTTFPAPFTKAEMDAAEARGKAMQKQMMDRKIAEDAKNIAPPVRAKVPQALTKEGCIPIPMTDSGPGPTTSLPAPSTK